MKSQRAIVAALLLSGCASAGSPPRGTLAWPVGNPRIRLEKVLRARQDVTRGLMKLLSRIVTEGNGILFRRPYGVAWDGPDLLVTDPGAHRAARVDAHGVTFFGARELVEPVGVASCREGFAVTDSRSGRVALFGRDLRWKRWLAEGLERPTGAACEGDALYVAETGRHRVLRIDVATGAMVSFGKRGDGDGEFNFPAALALGAGLLWVGDTLNSRVQKFGPGDGAFVGAFGTLGDAPGEMPRLKGIALDARGVLWISDAVLDSIGLFGQDGTFLFSLGRPGPEPGELSFPAGIAASPDGRVAVVDSLNRRVQIFRLADEVKQ